MQLIQELSGQPFMSPQLMQLSMVCGGNHGKIQVRLKVVLAQMLEQQPMQERWVKSGV